MVDLRALVAGGLPREAQNVNVNVDVDVDVQGTVTGEAQIKADISIKLEASRYLDGQMAKLDALSRLALRGAVGGIGSFDRHGTTMGGIDGVVGHTDDTMGGSVHGDSAVDMHTASILRRDNPRPA